jgi:Uma2 family endonuclease
MLESKVLLEGEPVELLEGLLVRKMGKKPRHRLVTELTRDALQEVLPTGWCVESQEPVATVSSEPEPDVAVLRGNRLEYAERHPGPNDVGMLVEVSDTTLDTDRGFKKQVYAAARIPVYWIMNLVANVVEIYTNPSGPAEEPDYNQSQVYGVTDMVPVVLDGQEVGRIPVLDLLRPAIG